MPSCLLRSPGLASGTWALVVVRDGRLRFGVATVPRIEVSVGPNRVQAIPPDVEYELSPLCPVHFSLDFLVVARVGEAASTSPTNGAQSPKRGTPEIGGDRSAGRTCCVPSVESCSGTVLIVRAVNGTPVIHEHGQPCGYMVDDAPLTNH
jgi:hypothetical protein